MEVDERKSRIHALTRQTLEALDVLIRQVKNPQASARLKEQSARLQERLKERRRDESSAGSQDSNCDPPHRSVRSLCSSLFDVDSQERSDMER